MGKVLYSSEWSASERAAAAKDARKETRPGKASPANPARAAVPADGVVRVGRETQGRKGGGVTVVTGIPLQGDALTAFAKELKAKLGTGGTLKDGVLELQGDVRDKVVALLTARGWTVKRVGG